MSLDAFHAAFTIDGFFVNQAEVDRLINALKRAGYTLRTNGHGHPGDGGISGFWKFTLDRKHPEIALEPDAPTESDAAQSDEGEEDEEVLDGN